ncbi:MAG: cation-translocating P-type ATPase, partial [Pseudomonadota bacterium]
METDSQITQPELGLTSIEAAKRLREWGPNEIIPSRLESLFSEAKKILLDPMGLMLLSLAILYLAIGYKTDAFILFCAYIPVTGVDVLLQIRAQKALKALSANILNVVKVVRDGEIQEIPTENLVVGDAILFEEGQSLPADGTIIEAQNLKINEAALTGESIPVDKTVGAPFWGGTVPLQGRGIGIIESTGRNTRFGKIASLLEKTEAETSPLQKKVNHLIHRFLWVALLLAGLLFVIEFWRENGWIHSLIVSATFGMSAIPEEFPLVFTLYLSLGAWRLSRHGVLVKSLPSVEALGSVDVICTDKTGTLTEGRFQLESITPLGSVPHELLWKAALMACEINVVDSMEQAIFEKGSSYRSLLDGWHLAFDYPFESSGKHMSHVWKNPLGMSFIAMKGAIEGVLEHCRVNQTELEQISSLTEALTQQGKRLLALAYREGECVGQRDSDERELIFLGLLIFNDPTRPSAKEAVLACQKAGIEIKMLTGDHPGTAHAVADEIGMDHDHQLLFTGDQLS